ncbi:unnamed protein product [Lactuca saligna]|uniref:PB1-like domain-containing protein n=1 Tax=Lactuca saligna TaxID=75948 RepID=A0AA35Z6J3_LACSI|nr:unnamed protein product [Lactuca saligna]
MVHSLWTIRPLTMGFDALELYVDHPHLFTIELRHGGKFTPFPNVRYVKGKVTYIDLVDIDEFSVHELDAMMLELGYVVPPVIYYHFRIPNEDLIFGLRALGNDQDVCNLAKYTGANKVIQVYIEHDTTNLVTYFMSPNKSESKSVSPEMRRTRNWKPKEGTRSCSKRLYMETETGDNQDNEAPSSEIKDNQDKEAPISEIRVDQDKEAPSSVTRDNQDKEVQQEHELDATTVHVPMGLIEMLNVDFDPFEGLHDSENNNITDLTTIYLGIEYQEFDQDNRGLFDGQSDEFNSEKGEDDYSDDDSDVIVDIDNEVDDIDVDMSDFRMNIDEGVKYYGFGFNNDVEDEQETDEEEDLEVIDCDEWESLGEDSDTEKNRRVLLKQLG